MSTAKELFKELGYEKAEKSESVVLYTNGYGDTILFKETKHVVITPVQGCRTIIMTCLLENAIHKQCEELGWIEEEERPETNFEHYKDEVIRTNFHFAVKNGDTMTCLECDCRNCLFHNDGLSCATKKMEWLCAKYKAEYKLTQFEYDLLNAYKNSGMLHCISTYGTLRELYGKGHFKGIDTITPIHEILKNCEIKGEEKND